MVAIEKENVELDGATMMLDGGTTDGSLLAPASLQPPAGLGLASVPAHCIVAPPLGFAGVHVTLTTFGMATTTSVAL